MEELLNDQAECKTNLEDSVHSNNKNVKKMYKCSACNEEFDQNQLIHTFICPNLNFDISETSRNPENIQNPNENLRPTAQIQKVVKNFKCTLCSKNYNSSDLKNHGPEKKCEHSLHKCEICVKAVSEGTCFYRCEVCVKDFSTEVDIKKHISSVHGNMIGWKVSSKNYEITQNSTVDEPKLDEIIQHSNVDEPNISEITQNSTVDEPRNLQETKESQIELPFESEIKIEPIIEQEIIETQNISNNDQHLQNYFIHRCENCDKDFNSVLDFSEHKILENCDKNFSIRQNIQNIENRSESFDERVKKHNIIHTHRHHQLANPGATVMCFRCS